MRPLRKSPALIGRRGWRRMRGFYAVEFALVLLVFMPLAFTAADVCRLALADRILARATHNAALAAGRDSANCASAARTAFADDRIALWLFDRNSDGSIGFVAGMEPDGTAMSEIRLDISADDGDVANGIAFDRALCGLGGSWISVRTAVPPRRWSWLGGAVLRHESWTVNQA